MALSSQNYMLWLVTLVPFDWMQYWPDVLLTQQTCIERILRIGTGLAGLGM